MDGHYLGIILSLSRPTKVDSSYSEVPAHQCPEKLGRSSVSYPFPLPWQNDFWKQHKKTGVVAHSSWGQSTEVGNRRPPTTLPLQSGHRERQTLVHSLLFSIWFGPGPHTWNRTTHIQGESFYLTLPPGELSRNALSDRPSSLSPRPF